MTRLLYMCSRRKDTALFIMYCRIRSDDGESRGIITIFI